MRARHFAGHPGLGVLLFLLIAALMIGLVVYLAVRVANDRPGHRGRGYGWKGAMGPGPMGPGPMAYGRDPALEHARVRYARGELTRDDYLRVVSDLGGQAPPDVPAAPAS